MTFVEPDGSLADWGFEGDREMLLNPDLWTHKHNRRVD